MAEQNINEKLLAIQAVLKAPKNQTNTFGKYKYRSCEDILEAVKPHLINAGVCLTLSDDIVEIAGRVYVKATATVANSNGSKSVTAYAREPEEKKGMDDSQITGTASSYARKYALNGLFAIDDTKDADTDEHAKALGKAPGKSAPDRKAKAAPAEPIQEPEPEPVGLPFDTCSVCGSFITAYQVKDKTGKVIKTYPQEAIVARSNELYKRPVCMQCMMIDADRKKKQGGLNNA